MQELIDLYINLKNKSKSYAEEFQSKFYTEFPTLPNAFFMIQTQSIITEEILFYYKNSWPPIPNIELKEDYFQRILLIERMCYIQSISDLERSSKQILKNIQNQKILNIKNTLSGKQQIFLKNIMNNAKVEGLINQNDYDDWNNLIDLRNHLIHNNAVANEDNTVVVAGLQIQYIKDQPLQGDLKFLPTLNHHLILLFKNFIDAF